MLNTIYINTCEHFIIKFNGIQIILQLFLILCKLLITGLPPSSPTNMRSLFNINVFNIHLKCHTHRNMVRVKMIVNNIRSVNTTTICM